MHIELVHNATLKRPLKPESRLENTLSKSTYGWSGPLKTCDSSPTKMFCFKARFTHNICGAKSPKPHLSARALHSQ